MEPDCQIDQLQVSEFFHEEANDKSDSHEAVTALATLDKGHADKLAAKAQEVTSICTSVAIGQAVTPVITHGMMAVGHVAGDAWVSGITASAYGGAGFPALGGKLVGGYMGKKLGKQIAGQSGKKIGKELGSACGATSIGAIAGASVAGPLGAAGGAGAGMASYVIGKGTARVVDRVAKWEGLAQARAPYMLKPGRGSCERSAAIYCIVTEEGLGNCYYYCFKEEQEALHSFKEWRCSRIMFEMESDYLSTELRRGGWPWHQASILKAAKRLRQPQEAAKKVQAMLPNSC